MWCWLETKAETHSQETKQILNIKINIKNHLLSDAGIFNLFGYIKFGEDFFSLFS